MKPTTKAKAAAESVPKVKKATEEISMSGFKIVSASDEINYDGAANTYIYMAVRRSDGYVGKPPELVKKRAYK